MKKEGGRNYIGGVNGGRTYIGGMQGGRPTIGGNPEFGGVPAGGQSVIDGGMANGGREA